MPSSLSSSASTRHGDLLLPVSRTSSNASLSIFGAAVPSFAKDGRAALPSKSMSLSSMYSAGDGGVGIGVAPGSLLGCKSWLHSTGFTPELGPSVAPAIEQELTPLSMTPIASIADLGQLPSIASANDLQLLCA